jgi:hypothetical protein
MLVDIPSALPAGIDLPVGKSSALLAGIDLPVGISSALPAGIDLVVSIGLSASIDSLGRQVIGPSGQHRPFRPASTFG